MMRFAEEIGPLRDLFLDLEYAASEPYQSFVFDTREEAMEANRLLLSQGCGEFSPPHGRLVLDDAGEPLGMTVFISKQDLMKSRLKAALVLHKAGMLGEDKAARVKLAAQALAKPGDDDLYWSRLSLVEAARGKGVGWWVLNQVTDEARRRGCKRVLGDVAPTNLVFLKLLYRNEYVELDRGKAMDPGTGRTLEYIHVVLDLK
jgi:GNAT superfamily N-acetyltransferase